MQVNTYKSYEQVCQDVSRKILDKIRKNPQIRLGLATGRTPLGIYQSICERWSYEKVSFQQVRTFNLDEYVGLGKNHPHSFYTYMKNHLLERIDLPESHFYIPNGMAKDLEEECERYENMIHQCGGIDLQILGVGVNGHIGFNEPGTALTSKTHVVSLTESTRIANRNDFGSRTEVPKKAITMGIATILEAKEIYLIADGEKKREALQWLLKQEDITEDWPVTALKRHSNVSIFVY